MTIAVCENRFADSQTLAEALAAELAARIRDAIAERGGAFRKRDETHRMAEANKAFSHFRW